MYKKYIGGIQTFYVRKLEGTYLRIKLKAVQKCENVSSNNANAKIWLANL